MKFPDIIYGVAQDIGNIPMIDTNDNVSFKAGDASEITVAISKDLGGYVNLTTNSANPVEIENTGTYKITLTASEAEFRTASLLFTGANIDEQLILLTSDIQRQLSRVAQSSEQTWYVNANGGNDSASGLLGFDPFETIGKAFDVANPRDTIRIAAGTYAEAGLDLDTSSVKVFADWGVIITGGGSGTGLVVSGGNCTLDDLFITPGAGQTGIVITGTLNRFCECSVLGGAKGYSNQSPSNELVSCVSALHTTTGFEIQSPVLMSKCSANGAGASVIGYHFTIDGNDSLLRQCISNNNLGNSVLFDAATGNNQLADFYSSSADGAVADNGAAGTNTVIMSTEMPAIDGAAKSMQAALTKFADDSGGADFDATTDSLEKIRNVMDSISAGIVNIEVGAILESNDLNFLVSLDLLGARVTNPTSIQIKVYNRAGVEQTTLTKVGADARGVFSVQWETATAKLTADNDYYANVAITVAPTTYTQNKFLVVK